MYLIGNFLKMTSSMFMIFCYIMSYIEKHIGKIIFACLPMSLD